MKRLSVTDIQAMKSGGTPIASLTAYDATLARVADEAGVDVLLVGDSLGMVVQGHESTLPVRLEDMVYHTRAAVRGSRRALVMTDLPFMSYATPERAFEAARAAMGDGGAQVVKLEGGAWLAPLIEALGERGVPVCGHLGLQPQSVHRLGGYRVQGREEQAAAALVADARVLEAAGAVMLVLECVPRALARTVTEALTIPTIGIGAGPDCDGQVLVVHDALGLNPHPPRFVRDFMAGAEGIGDAIGRYVAAVRRREFPADEHCFD